MYQENGSQFGQALKAWRSDRRLSQTALAGDIRTTTRHLSYLETGRSNPSRDMVFRLAGALNLPFRERNALLRAAGFADVFSERPLADEGMSALMRSIERVMAAHDPYPAFLLDRQWRILRVNDAAGRMVALVGTEKKVGTDQAPSVFDLTFDPSKLRPMILNWEDYAKHSIQRLLRESLERSDANAQIQRLRAFDGIPEDWWTFDAEHCVEPILPVHLEVNGNRLSFFSMVTTVGTPTDVTAQELRIESMFPADEETARKLGG